MPNWWAECGHLRSVVTSNGCTVRSSLEFSKEGSDQEVGRGATVATPRIYRFAAAAASARLLLLLPGSG